MKGSELLNLETKRKRTIIKARMLQGRLERVPHNGTSEEINQEDNGEAR